MCSPCGGQRLVRTQILLPSSCLPPHTSRHPSHERNPKFASGKTQQGCSWGRVGKGKMFFL